MSPYSCFPPDPGAICFGLSEELDRQSCAAYLRLLGRTELAQTLSARLSPREIEELIDLISSLMRKHLTTPEYHSLFLHEQHPDPDLDDQ